MERFIRIVVGGLRGVGMADGIYSIYRTKTHRKIPVILNSEEAAATDAAALESDWSHVNEEICRSYDKEIGRIHV